MSEQVVGELIEKSKLHEIPQEQPCLSQLPLDWAQLGFGSLVLAKASPQLSKKLVDYLSTRRILAEEQLQVWND